MTAGEKINIWVAKVNEMKEKIKNQTNTITKANELVNWYKEVTGDKCYHLNDAIAHKAKVETIKYFELNPICGN